MEETQTLVIISTLLLNLKSESQSSGINVPILLAGEIPWLFFPSLPHHGTQPLHNEGCQAVLTLAWLIPTQ